MSNEQNRDLMEDSEDAGLKAVMGGKFQDMSREIPTSPAPPRNDKVRRERDKYPSCLKTAADYKDPDHSKLYEGEWGSVPTYAPNWFDKLKGCGKYALIGGLLVAVFWYWNVTGQMVSAAAIPCMVACASWGGFRIGNVCRK